jgi:hypothetical protein
VHATLHGTVSVWCEIRTRKILTFDSSLRGKYKNYKRLSLYNFSYIVFWLYLLLL